MNTDILKTALQALSDEKLASIACQLFNAIAGEAYSEDHYDYDSQSGNYQFYCEESGTTSIITPTEMAADFWTDNCYEDLLDYLDLDIITPESLQQWSR